MLRSTKFTLSLLFSFTAFLISCDNDNSMQEFEDQAGYHEFESYKNFKTTLQNASDKTMEDSSLINGLWDSLLSHNQIPFIMNDSVAFLYKGNGQSISWAGDHTGWSPSAKGERMGDSDIFIYETTFPSDARIDYKVVVDNNWKLDPFNELIQYSGFGPNSELRMPEWSYPKEAIARDEVAKGSLTDHKIIASVNLGYDVQYRVYTPHNYDTQSNLPVVYVTDGHEYPDEKLGSMKIVLDNLIHDELVKPIIAVFIEPLNPANLSENRRADEYRANIKFANFVADELVSTIDSEYMTDPSTENRAILGTSYGGWNAAYFGLKRSDKFHLVGIHSPAFDQEIIDNYADTDKLPLKLYMSTGVIHDTEDKARMMKQVFDNKGYPLLYQEVNQGHSWGNWRGLLKQPLVYFFGTGG